MNNRYFILWVILFSGFTSSISGENSSKQKPLFPINVNHAFENPEECFEEVKNLIVENYYTTQITENDLYWAAIQGMLRHISPPEKPDMARIWTAEEIEKAASASGEIKVSIGVKSSFNVNDGSLTVTEILEGSPGEAIIEPLDRILRIDGELLKGKDIATINNLLHGIPGSEVTVTIVRSDKIFDVTLTRTQVTTKNLIVSVLPPGNIAFVEIKSISANISEELREKLSVLEHDNISKLILDIRNNTGGVFLDSLKIAELFLGEKKILLRTLSRSDKPQNYISSNKQPFPFEIVVLVNNKTALSSEIIVAALQDHKRAIIVGTKTYGESVFQKNFTLENAYRVKFITGAMYTPAGKSWQIRGLQPDLAVEQNEATYLALTKLQPIERLQKDIGLLTAYKLMNNKLAPLTRI